MFYVPTDAQSEKNEWVCVVALEHMSTEWNERLETSGEGNS